VILQPRARLALRIAQALALAGLVAYAAQSTWAVCGRGADEFFETYVYNGLVAAGALFALSRAAAVRSERAAWATLGLGLLAWAAGDAYYSIFLAELQAPPLPSVSDGLWLAFYPAAYVALVLLVRARVHDFHASLWLDGFVGALAAAALGAALVFGAVAGSGMDTTVVAVDLTYLLADLLLLAFVVGVFAVTGWRPGRSLLVLGAALAAGSVADGFFLYHAVTGTRLESTLMASLWPASALLAGFAAWQPAGGGRSPRLGGARLVIVPIGFAALALGVQGYAALVAPVNRLALSLATAALLAAVVRMAASLRENSVLLERSRREALVDPLTGLDNRRKLMLDLRRATHDISEEIPHALMLFDLDGFKQYNDRYGHPAGDALLTRLGDRLTMAVREGGRAYRLGGDEFCVLAQGAQDDLHELAGRARAALVENEPGVQISSSFGMVVLPEETQDITLALKMADERLYAHKGRRQTVAEALAS
jgi:two-component system, cell cycle response regulator